MSYYAFVSMKPDGHMTVIRPSDVSWTLVLGKQRCYFTLDELLHLPDFKKASARKKLEALVEGKSLLIKKVDDRTQYTCIHIYRLTTQNEALLLESVKVTTDLDVVIDKIKNSVPVELIESKKNLTQSLKQIKKLAKTLDTSVVLKI